MPSVDLMVSLSNHEVAATKQWLAHADPENKNGARRRRSFD